MNLFFDRLFIECGSHDALEPPNSRIRLRSAFATYFFFLVLLSLGNIIVSSYFLTDFTRDYGKITVRFLSCSLLILICTKYFQIKLNSSKKNGPDTSSYRVLPWSVLLGILLLCFLLSEDMMEFSILSQYDPHLAYELWFSHREFMYAPLDLDIQLCYGLFTTCVITPIAEEVFFRGLLFNAFQVHFKRTLSILLVALAFIFAHPRNFHFVGTLIFSATLSLIYLKYESLWPAIIAHSTYNLTSFLYEKLLERTILPLEDGKINTDNQMIFSYIFAVSSAALLWLFYSKLRLSRHSRRLTPQCRKFFSPK